MVNKGAPTHAQSGHIYTVYAGGNQTAKGHVRSGAHRQNDMFRGSMDKLNLCSVSE